MTPVASTHLLKLERRLVIDGVDAVGGHSARAVLLPDRVSRQPVHLHLHVRAHLAVGQELTGYDLREACA